jgi:tetratricopeptide (TPR) repeat protein
MAVLGIQVLRNKEMKRVTAIVFCVFFILFNRHIGLFGQEKADSGGIRKGYESEYYYAFTEATRYMIYQYYNQAVGLYKTCLEYNPGSAAIKYQLSRIYYRTGYIDEAKKLGIEAWNGEKENRYYLLNLITIYQTTNKIDSAILFTKELIALEPGTIDNYLKLSVLYEIGGDYRKALNLLDQIENTFGKSVGIFTLRYNIYKSIEKNNKAIQQLYYAQEREPENLSIIGLIAEYYRDSGAQDSASKYYNLLLSGDGGDPVTIFSYIDYLLRFSEYHEAQQYFSSSLNNATIGKEQATEYFLNKLELNHEISKSKVFYDSAVSLLNSLNENDLRISALYVDYNFKVNNYNEAANKLKELILTNGQNYRIWEQLLFAENNLNQSDSLIEYSDKAIYLFEDQPLPYLYSGIAYLQKKDYSLALKGLEKGFKYAENKNVYLQYCIFIAEAYNGLQNHEKSFEYYEKALSIDSSNVLIMNNYAYFLALDGKDLEKAKRLSRQTIKKEKTNAIYLDTYAWIFYKMDKNLKAKHYIRKAVKYGGDSDKEIKDHYNTIFKINSGTEN